MQLQIKKLHLNAKMPQFAHSSDAGLDLCTVIDFTINPGEHRLIPTGLAIVFPDGYTALVWDKGGIANKVGGVFDTEYRGEYLIGLYNFGTEPQSFVVGDKIAQLLIQKVEHPEIIEVDELDETERGDGAFGSTGV
jgi:dUTP pyrophosphatase